jgi:hypothetical protein
MHEFEFCWREDLDATFAGNFNYPPDEAGELTFTLINDEAEGGDVATATFTVRNDPQ